MDGLLIATGFTGALTLVWLTRRAAGLLWPPPTAAAHLGPGGNCVEAVVREINAARKEVVFQADELVCRPVAQALIDARLRRANVEVVVGPDAEGAPDVDFLREQGLVPQVSDRPLGPPLVLIDGRVLLAATFPLTGPTDGDAASGRLIIIKGHPELVRTCRQGPPHSEAPAAAPPVAGDTPTSPPPARPEAPAPAAPLSPRPEPPAPVGAGIAPGVAVPQAPSVGAEGPDPLEALARANAEQEDEPRARPAPADAGLRHVEPDVEDEIEPPAAEPASVEKPRAPTMKAAIELMERLRRQAALADKEEEGDERAA